MIVVLLGLTVAQSGQLVRMRAAIGADPPNARKRTTLRLRKAHMLKREFKALWDRIRHKTRYAVTIDSHRLVEDVRPELGSVPIRKARASVSKAEVIANDKDTFEALTQSGARTAIDLAGRYPLPNLVEIMENLMENTSPPMWVSRRTLLEIFRRSDNRTAALDNPHEFATAAVNIVKNKLADQLVEGIRYEKLDEWYEMTPYGIQNRRSARSNSRRRTQKRPRNSG